MKISLLSHCFKYGLIIPVKYWICFYFCDRLSHDENNVKKKLIDQNKKVYTILKIPDPEVNFVSVMIPAPIA